MTIPDSTTVPVLLIIFNRPDKVRQLITALETVKPTKIYIAGDGPRASVTNDIEKCTLARQVATAIPWPCEVKTRFSDTNFGCRYGVTDAIDWFFENEEAGIILEDDCIPHPTFFSFCQNLLSKYENEEKIMHISGNNFQDGTLRGDGSYYFSLYTHSWGWATWRRAWQHYHQALEQFATFDRENKITRLPLSKSAQRFWLKNFRQTIKGNDSWDSLWLYTVWSQEGLAIIPNKNLVSNIGFDNEATHTILNTSQAKIPTQPIFGIEEPSNKRSDFSADEYTFRTLYYRSPWQRIFSKIGGKINRNI